MKNVFTCINPSSFFLIFEKKTRFSAHYNRCFCLADPTNVDHPFNILTAVTSPIRRRHRFLLGTPRDVTRPIFLTAGNPKEFPFYGHMTHVNTPRLAETGHMIRTSNMAGF